MSGEGRGRGFAVVWLDRLHAKVFRLSDDWMERSSVPNETGGGDGLSGFFREVAERLTGDARILVLGPDGTRTHFREFLRESLPEIERKVVGCEESAQPADAQIAAQAIRYFRKSLAE